MSPAEGQKANAANVHIEQNLLFIKNLPVFFRRFTGKR